jgi:FlaA1/EpsC-like NDP-sugar epimerase
MVPQTDINKLISSELEGKNILVTGGAGSIGNEIVTHLLRYNPNVIRIIENNEANLFKLKQQTSKEDQERLRFFLGDIRDITRIKKAMKGIDIVFHAAALKHVEMSEENPFEAIKTNVYGTENTIEAAINAGVQKFVNISTDKAASPLNVMGATKLLSEKLVTAAERWKGLTGPKFCSVRFGNVFGSKGSVYPIIRNQVLNEKPVTITNPNMTRFIMSVPDAVDLIMFSLVHMKGGEVFVPKMKSIVVEDLIKFIVSFVCSKFDKDTTNIDVSTINIRAGEKIHEHLIASDEMQFTYEYKNYYVIIPTLALSVLNQWKNVSVKVEGTSISSDDIEQIMSEDDLIKLMIEAEKNNRIML